MSAPTCYRELAEKHVPRIRAANEGRLNRDVVATELLADAARIGIGGEMLQMILLSAIFGSSLDETEGTR